MKQLITVIISLFSLVNFAQDTRTFFLKADEFLKENVKDGRVNYESIKKEPSALNALISDIETLAYTEQEEKAYLINVYNLYVIYKVVQEYPTTSPMDLSDFFGKKNVNLNGEKISLDYLENKILRPKYKDPRFHFSLVCGAIGCPVLRSEAYTPNKLETQLEEQTTKAINNKRFVYADSRQGKIYVSEIFMWYKEDFGGSNAAIIAYLNKYAVEKFNTDGKLETYAYDWSLNDSKHTLRDEVDMNTAGDSTANNTGEPADEFNLQTFTAGSLLGKNKFDFTLFNTIYTENKNNWKGTTFTGYRATFVTHLLQVTYGVSKSKRINIGIDLNLKNNGRSVDSTASGLGTAFGYSNTDSTRFGLTSVGARIKVQPFKKVNNFSIQSTVYVPIVKDPEGVFLSTGNPGNRYWADWDRVTWWNQFFFDKTWGKIQLFAEADLLFRFAWKEHQIGMLDIPMSVFISYFPTKKITLYAMSQHVPRLTNNITPQDPLITDWVIPMNYTASGLGFKYNITNGFNLELLYTNFWRGQNSGLGQTFNLGIKYIML